MGGFWGEGIKNCCYIDTNCDTKNGDNDIFRSFDEENHMLNLISPILFTPEMEKRLGEIAIYLSQKMNNHFLKGDIINVTFGFKKISFTVTEKKTRETHKFNG